MGEGVAPPAEEQHSPSRATPNSVAGRALLGAVIGLAGGALGGVAGLGGGVIMVPLMTALFGLTQHEAHGSSMLAVLFTALAGGAGYALHADGPAVNLVAAIAVAASAVTTAGYGARLSHRLSARRLKRFFGFFLVTMAVVLPVSRQLLATHAAAAAAPENTLAVAAGGLAIGLVSGFLAGLMGVGGGAIVVPALVIGVGLPQHVAQGTSLVQMIPTAISGTMTHHRLRHTRWDVAPWVGLGAIGGGWLGAYVAGLLPSTTLTYVFSALIFLMGLQYLRTTGAPRTDSPLRA